MSSWKTTVLGVLTVVVALASAGISLLDNDPLTQPNLIELGAAFSGLAAVFARDNKVSSKQAGAK